jgi:hypothetical protein
MDVVDSRSDVEVRRGVAELAARLGDRLPEVVAAISVSLRDYIPDLRDEAQIPRVASHSRVFRSTFWPASTDWGSAVSRI